jgi:hypothetical protein
MRGALILEGFPPLVPVCHHGFHDGLGHDKTGLVEDDPDPERAKSNQVARDAARCATE